jgi:endonuclease/exonuclease/phosphatase (EEP) superfamily protein YafD
MKDRFRRAAPIAAVALVALSVLLRITVRDRVPVLAAVYYGIPPVVGACLLLAPCLLWLASNRRKAALAAGAGALLLIAWQAGVSWFRRPAGEGELRVLVWNTKNGSRGWERIAAQSASYDPDVVCLIEAQKSGAELERELPGREWKKLGDGLVAGFRGKILGAERHDLDGGEAVVVSGTVRGRPISVVLVDLASNPLLPRGPVFRRLEALLDRVRPDLVAGDFNTPRDSAFFDSWRGRFVHAFEAAGDGLDLTWPMPLPVLSIDHAWCGPRLDPRACRHEGSWASDHRAVVAELAWLSE